MAIPRQVIDIPIGMGLDEKTGEPSVAAGKLLAAQNVHTVKTGSLQSRPGFSALTKTCTDAGTIAAGKRLMACESELLLSDGDYLYTYLPTGSVLWREMDRVPEATIASRTYGERGRHTIDAPCDAAYGVGCIVSAFLGPNASAYPDQLHLRVTDTATGARHAEQTITVGVGSKLRLLVIGSTAFVFYHNAAQTHISVRKLTLSSPHSVWSAEANLVLCEGGAFEAYTDGLVITLAWDGSTRAGGGTVMVERLSAALAVTLGPTACSYPSAGTITCCHKPGGSTWVIYDTSIGATPNGLHCDVLTAALVLDQDGQIDADIYAGSNGAIKMLGSRYRSTGDAIVSYSVEGVGASVRETALRVVAVDTNAGVTHRCHTYHLRAWSEPIYDATRGLVYMLATIPESSAVEYVDGASTTWTQYRNRAVTVDSGQSGSHGTPQWGAFLVDVTPSASETWEAAPQARAVSRVAWQMAAETNQSYPVGFWPSTAYHYMAAVAQLIQDVTSDGSMGSSEGFDFFDFDSAPVSVHVPVQANHELVLSGGVPTCYDSSRVVEYGFNWYPALQGVDTEVTGGLAASSTYGYAATYEYRDSKGVLQQSAPGMLQHYTSTDKLTVRISVACLTLTDRDDIGFPVRICLWRTLANGSLYYLLDSKENDPAQPSVTFTDDGVAGYGADSLLRDNRQLYVNGGVVENVAPPAFRHVCYHANRFWGISADDPECVWMSKLHTQDELPGFNDAWVMRAVGSDLRALAAVEGKLVLLARDRILVVFGSGPTDTDQGNDLSDPQVVCPTIGARDPRALVQSPVGLFFHAQDGIYLLDRSLSVKPIGLPVEATLATNGPVTGAALCEDVQEVRFSSSGYTLVYQYLLDQWFSWKVLDSAGASTPHASCCVALVAGTQTFHLLTTAGQVLRQSGNRDADSTYPAQTFTSAWLHFAGVQGYQRVRRVSLLGDYMGRCAVTVYGYADYESGSAFSKSWTEAEIDAMADKGRVQLQIHVPTQKCEALSFKVSTTPAAQAVGSPNPDTSALGVRWTGLSLEVGAKRGHHRNLSSSERK